MDFRPEQIIISADVTLKQLIEIINSGVLPKGTIIKLSRLFFIRYGLNAIKLCQDVGYPVFADAKIEEIPDNSMEIAREYLKYKPWMLNAMANICSNGEVPTEADKDRDYENDKSIDALARFAKLCSNYGTKSCAVTVLTSKTDDMVLYEYDTTPKEQVLRYVSLMEKCKLTDIVCSPKEAKFIREDATFDMLSINTPGVRLPDSSKDDQARVLAPAEALATYCDRIVIGRDLTRRNESLPLIERIAKNYQDISEHIRNYVA